MVKSPSTIHASIFQHLYSEFPFFLTLYNTAPQSPTSPEMPFVPIQKGDAPINQPPVAANPPTLDDLARQLNYVEINAGWACQLLHIFSTFNTFTLSHLPPSLLSPFHQRDRL
jgi:hypothetical protein